MTVIVTVNVPAPIDHSLSLTVAFSLPNDLLTIILIVLIRCTGEDEIKWM